MNADALILGGGPSGSSAACFLARKGWRVTLLERIDGQWVDYSKPNPDLAGERAAVVAGRVEVRAVQRRQVFIGGKPAGAPFE